MLTVRKYELVMRDVGGVLLDHRDSRHYRKISKELGIPEKEFQRMGNKLARSLERRKMRMPEVEKAILEKFRIKEKSKVRGVWARTFRQSVRKNEEVIDLLEKLSKKGYSIAITTNTNIPFHTVSLNRNKVKQGNSQLLSPYPPRIYPYSASFYLFKVNNILPHPAESLLIFKSLTRYMFEIP